MTVWYGASAYTGSSGLVRIWAIAGRTDGAKEALANCHRPNTGQRRERCGKRNLRHKIRTQMQRKPQTFTSQLESRSNLAPKKKKQTPASITDPALHRPVPFSNSCSQGQSEHLHSYLGYSGAELIHSNVAAEAVAYVAHPPTKKKSLHLSFGIILAITTNRRCCSLS